MSEQTIGGADAPEEARVINARSEHVNGLDQAQILGDAVDGGVIRRRQAGEHGWVFDLGQPRQHRLEVRRGDLGSAAGILHELREPELGKINRVGPFPGAGTELLVLKNVARTRTARVAYTVPQPLRACHHPPALGQVDLHAQAVLGTSSNRI